MRQVTALGPTDALERTRQCSFAAGADLDDDDERAALSHDVELESAESQVPRQDPKAAGKEEVSDRELRPPTRLGATQRAGTF